MRQIKKNAVLTVVLLRQFYYDKPKIAVLIIRRFGLRKFI